MSMLLRKAGREVQTAVPVLRNCMKVKILILKARTFYNGCGQIKEMNRHTEKENLWTANRKE